ncbi:NAD-dependent DNA ligase LigA [Mycoplasma anatis]|uniref:NAD-dependent DNA ligase LigA n=1 Tax=Mycoplasmopsis anatis TaxID=171279 RepID=UPI001C4E0FC7|nr:NAD-dependent DNA ligase LigA [Mycoplasmopsis anatis]MBW0596312.1 NAD-dependent DNA ligase LigA [Mycoplasmopsis anatis]MBW0599904.1 NAD-dependent DNA ligase LigA [Mycoplasmopsis anatis]MBW0600689.1 NAD-dependent DNA ligase LigA [Mycoplasmopsis anatis]
MNVKQAQGRIKELITKIKEYNHHYYDLDNPIVSDAEYDKLYNELVDLENKFPELVTKDSPTQIIGGFAANKFTKFEHKKAMLSLSKAYDFDEIKKFHENIIKKIDETKISYALDYKIDGLSISLHYQNGKLIRAVTRGDGITGEDVTENIIQISSIPQKINYLKEIEIRGEVYISKKTLIDINNALKKENKQEFSNPRNAASGTLRQLDPTIVKQRNLSAFLYEVVEPLQHNLHFQSKVIEFINKLGFPTQTYFRKVTELEEIYEEIDKFAEVKNKLDYDCDGFVIKLNNIDIWEDLGYTAKFPRYAIAFKLETESANTKILNITTSVGRTGKITYVANVEPVELNQTNVQFATLHNYEFIKELNLNINDEVKLIKAGEIIPKVIELVKKNSTDVYPKTMNCPSCNTLLEYIDDNVDQFCVNENCDEKKIRKIIHFASRPSLNIVNLGESNIRIFFELGLIKEVYDIYNLVEHKNKILQLRTFKEKKVNNILESIENSKTNKLNKIIFALGIKHIGERASKIIAKKINSISELLTYDIDSLENESDFGTKSVESLKKWLSDENNVNTINHLSKIFTSSVKTNSTKKLDNLIFVITGTFELKREELKEIIEQNGGVVSSSVSNKTNYLLCGENAGSKKTKAEQLNIEIIDDKFLFNLIK